MKKLLGVLGAIALVALIGCAFYGDVDAQSVQQSGSVFVSGTEEVRKISVTGQAELEVAPDEAYISISVVNTADTAKRAQEINAEHMTAVQEALTGGLLTGGVGVAKEDIETVGFNLYPKTKYNRDTGESTVIGYEVRHRLKVTVKDIDNVGNILDLGVFSGANRVDSVNFGLSKAKQKQLKTQLLTLAADNAEEKAGVLAKALDMNVGKPVHVREGHVSVAPYPQPRYAMAESAMMDMAAPTPIQPGDVTTSVSISVDFEMQ